MNFTAHLAALLELCRGPWKPGPQLSQAMLIQLGMVCLKILTGIGQLVHESKDPRLALIQLELIERVEQQLHYQKAAVALDVELTAAHALSLPTLDALHRVAEQPASEVDAFFAKPPELAAGRTCYGNAAEVIAAWLGISYFDAKRRIDDAHLLIGRRVPSGEQCEPRFQHLAALFAGGGVDRRAIARVSRQLEKLEPEDTTFDGVGTELQARGSDGLPLEESAARILVDHGPNAARKQIDAQINQYKQAHGMILPPKLGFFVGKVIGGVHCFHLRTDATQAEVFHSMAAQSSNLRTKAGRAARKKARLDEDQANEPATEHDGGTGTGTGQEQDRSSAATPDWLISEQPMPEWARGESGQERDAPDHGFAGDSAAGPPEDRPTGNAARQADSPSAAERRLNALMAMLVASRTSGKSKSIVPKVLVYMWLSDLQNLAEAHGVSAHGVDIPPGELRRLLAHAGVIPLVLGSNSQPLDMGRSRRFHKGAIRTAIMARDRGCIVPDCTTPPEKTETDHYEVPWSEGGETSVWSGAGVCTTGHHQRHAEQIKIVDVDGLPHVILPEHLDPEQKPRRNTYWGALQLGDAPEPALPDPSCEPEQG
ncbi:13E12 repeat family protein [Glutamicibacter sp. JL.03c]|uniref:13E12 repeat family protein n=1 Tax=Glutamicibacter sp. JL.03c TaxID=2984842 RepID=UPI0021F6A790|nr:13E12 repeat family protein [Glutamicibacter sp. JL.03c]UYQ79077.1 13E12 repeat family protein [Glutamicibacter sp. JL.03c]